MVMLTAVCAWHAIVACLDTQEKRDFIESIVLSCLAIVYVLYNIGFFIIIYISVSSTCDQAFNFYHYLYIGKFVLSIIYFARYKKIMSNGDGALLWTFTYDINYNILQETIYII